MRALRLISLVLVSVQVFVLSGCATTESAPVDIYARNVVFTVPGDVVSVDVLSGYSASGQLNTGAGTADNVGASQILIQAVLRSHGLRKVSQFRLHALNLEAVVADIGERQSLSEVVEALTQDNRVSSVETVKNFKLMSYNDPYYSLQNTVVSDRIEHIHTLTTGKNVTVGMVDTGVDRLHPELRGRIVYSKNLVSHDQDAFDLDEHGTAVAGVIGSKANNDLGIVGVAPDVGLMVFKACHQDRQTRKTGCDSVSIIKALNDVLIQKPDILNLSLSGPQDPIIERLLKRAYRDGIILVGAVDEKGLLEESFPARMPEVIAVGTTFTSGEQVDMVRAPGTDILTTAPGSTYGFKTGSSMATAYVSGIIALMKERDPGLVGTEAFRRLLLSSQLDEDRLPVVDMCSAIQLSDAIAACDGTPNVAVVDPQRPDSLNVRFGE